MTNLETQKSTSNPPMALKVGVMGSASSKQEDSFFQKAHELGQVIARSEAITITGACPGLPMAAAQGAKSAGGTVIGISPALSLDEHLDKYHSPAEFHDVLIFTGSGLMGREVVNIRTSDIVVIVGGSSGTLGELAIAYDEGKLIGVLEGTGGITRMIPEILDACNKDTGARLIYDSSPSDLIRQLIEVYTTEHYRRPSCFSTSSEVHNEPSGFATARDPVCGMWLNPDKAAAHREIEDQTFWFCCTPCAVAFEQNPTKYLTHDT